MWPDVCNQSIWKWNVQRATKPLQPTRTICEEWQYMSPQSTIQKCYRPRMARRTEPVIKNKCGQTTYKGIHIREQNTTSETCTDFSMLCKTLGHHSLCACLWVSLFLKDTSCSERYQPWHYSFTPKLWNSYHLFCQLFPGKWTLLRAGLSWIYWRWWIALQSVIHCRFPLWRHPPLSRYSDTAG